MLKRDTYLSGPSYALGEIRKRFDQADGYAEALDALGGANFPELWGWGHYHETGDVYRLGVEAGRQALAAAALPPGDIDLVVIAAASFPENPNALSSRLGAAMKELGCVNALLEGHTLAGCASYLSALQLAASRIGSGELGRVLVIGLGSMGPDMQRFSSFALFSDAACATVLAADGTASGYRLVDAAQCIDHDEMAGGIALDSKSLLQIRTIDTLLDRNKLARSDIAKVFNNNVFLPVKKTKDGRCGFKSAQVYTDNVARIGHCHVCDSMINLIDHASRVPAAAPELLLLQSDGNGRSICLLLESVQAC